MTDPITHSMMQGAAGASGAGDLYVNDIFNLDIYKGKSGVGIAITNGMDYTKPSMVVIKNKERTGKAWWIYDNEANIKPDGGDGNIFWNSTNGTDIGYNSTYNITRNDTGYVSPTTDDNELGVNGDYYISYSFKKKENFFDIVTYTGTGSLRTIAHNLGAVPAMIWVKQYGNNGQNWRVYHHRVSNNATNSAAYVMKLNTNAARQGESAAWNNTAPTATHFTVGTEFAVNGNGQKYVAYLFADHSDNSGTFGENEDQNIIACGNYTGNSSSNGPNVNLGWEPDWLMIKRRDNNENWFTCDQMHQMPGSEDRPTPWMKMDTTDANYTNDPKVMSTPTGFTLISTDAMINANGEQYIYCAIRRPELTVARPITSPTEVFDMDNSADLDNAGFPCFPVRGIRKVDFATARQPAASESWYASDRKMGRDGILLQTSNARIAWSNMRFDILHGWNSTWTTANYQTWAWARNPGSFDIQYHEGNGNSQSPYHRLGVVPEMIWVKRLSSAADWGVYHFGTNNANNPQGHYLQLNEQQWAPSSTSYWNSTVPTATQYTVGSAGQTNASNDWYLTYLFASKEGVSKLGYYTGTGASGNSITFGFQPRFVLIKCSNANSTPWGVWDSMRGWDKMMDISQTSAQTNFQAFSVSSTGITFDDGDGRTNGSGRYYIYYAHA